MRRMRHVLQVAQISHGFVAGGNEGEGALSREAYDCAYGSEDFCGDHPGSKNSCENIECAQNGSNLIFDSKVSNGVSSGMCWDLY